MFDVWWFIWLKIFFVLFESIWWRGFWGGFILFDIYFCSKIGVDFFEGRFCCGFGGDFFFGGIYFDEFRFDGSLFG